MDPAMAFVLALSLIVPRLTVADSPLRLQRSFWTSACTSILEERQNVSSFIFANKLPFHIQGMALCLSSNQNSSSLLPVVAAARQAACDACPGECRGAGVIAHVVPLGGAHAAALHVAPTDAEAQASQTADAGSVAEARVVEPRLRHRGRV